MIFLSCYIENYGRLHDLSLSFSSGMNTLFAENGSGKTTLLSFFRAILYGLPAGTKTNPQENERRHYTPWQGGRFGGSLSFSHNGKSYTAVRYFGERESLDSFELYDAATQLPSKDYSERLGEELFSLDSESFMKSVLLPAYEKDRFASRGATLLEKLSRYVEDSDGAVSYEEALKALEKQRKVYIKTGNKGLLPETEAEIQAISLRRLQAERDRERAAALEKEIASLTEERAALLSKDDACTREILALSKEESARSIRSYGEGLRRSAEESAAALSELRRSFGASVPDKAALEKAAGDAYRLDSLPPLDAPLSFAEEKELLSLSARFRGRVPTEEELLTDARRVASENKPRKNAAASLLLFFLFLIAALPLYFWQPILALGCGALSLFSLLCFFLGRSSLRKRGDADFLSYLSEASAARLRYMALLEKKQAAVAAIESDAHARESEAARLTSYAAAYGEEAGTLSERFGSLSARYEQYVQLIAEAKHKESALSSFQSEHADTGDMPSSAAFGAVTAKDKEREREQLRRRMEAVEAELDEKRRIYLPIRESIAQIEEYRLEEMRLSEKAKEYRRAACAIENAEKLLLLAKNNLATRYLSDMQARYAGYLARFLPRLSEEALLSADLALKVKSGSARFSPLYMSDGVQEILSFSMHMALSDALFEGEKPPLFLDDPFSLWDDEKTAAGLSFLEKESEGRQIFYVTCQSSRLPQGGHALSL